MAGSAEGLPGVTVYRAHVPVCPVHAHVRAQEDGAQVAPRSSAGSVITQKKTDGTGEN